ncbi:DUF4262 domain-containing protein [Nonomuraea sp. NPDC049400]|uniref:DUF4262 domain-containing protein n=1 Tax=Nonomuraea sp. NPDC049400 TaxID=3364352 RepID=UPI0037ADEAD2
MRVYGWHIQGVGDLQMPWTYTIGLAARELPELIVAGLGLRQSGALLNAIASCWVEGVDVRDPRALATAFGHDRVVLQLRSVDPSWNNSSLFNVARSHLGVVPAALQVVIADVEGRFPWDAGHQLGIEQPRLWEAWPGGWPDVDPPAGAPARPPGAPPGAGPRPRRPASRRPGDLDRDKPLASLRRRRQREGARW